MRSVLAVMKREFVALFMGPMAYCVFLIFYAFSSYFFCLTLYYSPTTDVMQYLFGNMVLVLLLMCPLMTMSVFVKDHANGMLELLLTSPVSLWQLVLGKFLSILLFFLLMLVSTLVYVVALAYLGSPEWGSILSGYLGVSLVGASFIAIGVFTSSFSRSQVVAATVSTALCSGLWALGWASNVATTSLGKWVKALSFLDHFSPYEKGIVMVSDTVFYLLFMCFFLILTHHVLWLNRKVGQ